VIGDWGKGRTNERGRRTFQSQSRERNARTVLLSIEGPKKKQFFKKLRLAPVIVLRMGDQ
jgi:hypothetical protein